MASKSKLPEPRHLQSVVEWRYPKAHGYWDDCGKTMAAVEAAFPGLLCEGLDENRGFRFEGKSKGITSAGFYWDLASVTQTALGDAGLGVPATRFMDVVRKVLSISEVIRLGHRTWSIYETETPKEAERWLLDASVWQFASQENALGEPNQNGIVLRTRQADGRKLRIEVGAGSMAIKAPARTYHGVIVDVDINIESPSELLQDTDAFITSNLRFLRDSIDPLFRRK